MASGESHWVKVVSTQSNIRGVALDATQLVKSLTELHGVKGEDARALGEATMGALLTASYCKAGERVNLNIQGTGIVKQALVEAYPEGTARGYIIPRASDEKITPISDDLGPWGTGLLSVLRTKEQESEKPYIGTVPLLTGHLAKDLTFYWHQSEQIPSAVGLVVNLKGDQVASAGGFLVQAMSGATSDEIKIIDQHIHEIDSLAEMVSADPKPMSVLAQIFQDTPFMIVEDRKVHTECRCSWDRVRRALTLVGVEEMRAMLKEKGATVRCDFCTKEYKVEPDLLNELIDAAREPKK